MFRSGGPCAAPGFLPGLSAPQRIYAVRLHNDSGARQSLRLRFFRRIHPSGRGSRDVRVHPGRGSGGHAGAGRATAHADAWLPISGFYDLIEATVRVAFGGKPGGMFQIGRHQMQRDMTGIYKIFVRMASPQTVISKAASIYGTYTTNGTMKAKQIEPNVAEVTIEGVDRGMPGYWEYQRGTITGVLEQTAKDLSCEIVDGGGMTTRAVYRARWRGRG